ncbi:MAG: hypothetical protein WC216_11230 [Gallionella sp.]|jgi:hypothetical protein
MINDLEKRRELLFTAEPADQITRAQTILNGLPNLQACSTSAPNALEIRYNLRDYTLEDLERALEHEGFHLDHSFLHQVARNIIYYCEDTCRHNMEIRGHLTKKNEKELFLEVSGHHMHQERAAIPPELREFE